MAKLILGSPAAQAIIGKTKLRAAALAGRGVTPRLAIVRFGERDGDIAYERGIRKTLGQIGIAAESTVLSSDAPTEELLLLLRTLSHDHTRHGILPMRPFPSQIDDMQARNALPPEKDVDGVCDVSLSGLFTGIRSGFAPCTAEACIALLEHESLPIEGKRVVVVGRSLVVGKPVGMLLLQKNATVTYAHSRTADLAAVTKAADILIVAAGRRALIGAEHVRQGQIILDVGMHFDGSGNLCGDVRFEEVEPIVSAITPARGGVGAVTTSILARHVIQAAENSTLT
jgi:methylenetetrahydrofolate dehydrogenase (NADP+)/methenyltetrahydrofolate cyclohydrolase